LAVAVQTPLHLQRGDLPGQRHQIHPSMAGGTANPLVNVDAVVEIDKVREIVYSGPLNRFAGPPTLPNGFEIGTVGKDLRMTIHARFGRWNTGKSRNLHGGMTVTAIDPFISYVMLVAELDRLFSRHIGLGDVGRSIHLSHHPNQAGNDEQGTEYRDPGNRISAGMEDLRHSFKFSLQTRLIPGNLPYKQDITNL